MPSSRSTKAAAARCATASRSASAVQLAEKVYQTYRARGDRPRRPQRVAAPRQRDLPARRQRLPALAQVRLSAAPQCRDARQFRARWRDRERRRCAAAIKALLAGTNDAAALAPLLGRPNYNAQMRTTCVATHARSRHAGERAAADRARHRQLPHPAGRAGRRDRQASSRASSPTRRSASRPKAGRWRRRPRRRIPRS